MDRSANIGDSLEISSYTYDNHVMIEIRLLAIKYKDGTSIQKEDFLYQFGEDVDLSYADFKKKFNLYYSNFRADIPRIIKNKKDDLYLALKQDNKKELVLCGNNCLLIGTFRTYYTIINVAIIHGIIKLSRSSSPSQYYVFYCLALKAKDDAWINTAIDCISDETNRTYSSGGGVIIDTDDQPILD